MNRIDEMPIPCTWDSVGPGEVFWCSNTRTKSSHTPLFIFLDALTKRIPGWNNKQLVKLHRVPCPQIDPAKYLEPNLETISSRPKRPRFVVLLVDQILEGRLPQIMGELFSYTATHHRLTPGISAALLTTAEPRSFKEKSLHVQTSTQSEVYNNGVRGIDYRKVPGVEINKYDYVTTKGTLATSSDIFVPASYWPILDCSKLEIALKSLAVYLIYLGKDLKLLSEQEAQAINLTQLVRNVIFEVLGNFQTHLTNLEAGLSSNQGADPMLEVSNPSRVIDDRHLDWNNENPHRTNLEEYLKQQSLISSVDGQIFLSAWNNPPLIETPIEEEATTEAPKRSKSSPQSLTPRDVEDLSYLGEINGIPITSYPSTAYIESIIGKPKIQNRRDLGQVWDSLGIPVANIDSEKTFCKNLIESNWLEIHRNTGITRRWDYENKEFIYYFSRAHERQDHSWGAINGIPLEKFPYRKFIRDAINQPLARMAEDLNELKKVWDALGLRIATPAEELDLPRRLFEENFDKIRPVTGLERRWNPQTERFTYYTSFAKYPGKAFGYKDSNDNYVSFLPRGLLKEMGIKGSPESWNDFTRICESLKINLAKPEEERNFPGIIFEENWDTISKNMGLLRKRDADGKYSYYFSLAKKTKWGTIHNIEAASYPSCDAILNALSENVIDLDKRKPMRVFDINEFAQVCDSFGIKRATDDNVNAAFKLALDEYWTDIEKLGIKRSRNNEAEPYTYDFTQFKVIDGKWPLIANIWNPRTFPTPEAVASNNKGKPQMTSIKDIQEYWNKLSAA